MVNFFIKWEIYIKKNSISVSMYKLHSILEAACLTAVIVVALFFYTLQSRRDFVKGYALSFSLLSVLLMASMLQVNTFAFLVR